MHTNAVRRKRQEEITIPFPSFSQPITMNTNINHIERDHQVNLPEEQRAQYNAQQAAFERNRRANKS